VCVCALVLYVRACLWVYMCVCVRFSPRLVHGNGIDAMQALILCRVGQNHIHIYGVYIIYTVYIPYIYIRCVYDIFGRKITINTVIYAVYIRIYI